jgi:hypothetical protein
MFGIGGATPNEQETSARAEAKKVKKSAFALKYAIDNTAWITPGYIADGVKWLAAADTPAENLPIEAVHGETPETHDGAENGK